MFKSRFFIISLVLVAIIVISAWLVHDGNKNVDANVWNMIPNDVALIVEIDNPRDIFQLLSVDNSIWQSLDKIASVQQLMSGISNIDTLLKSNSEYLQLLNTSPVTIAFYPDTITGIQTILLSKIKSYVSISDVKHVLSTSLGREYGLLEIAQIQNSFKMVDSQSGVVGYFAFVDGIFIYSSSLKLMTKVISTNSGNSPKLIDDNTFIRLQQTAGLKVHARVYMQYSKMSQLIKPLINTTYDSQINWLANFSGWTEVDVLIKNDELIFSGFSVSESNESFLYKLKGQQAVSTNVLNIIPYNTNMFVWIGTSDFKKYFYASNSESSVKSNSAFLQFDINRFVNVVGNEIVLTSNATSVNGVKNNSWFIVNVNNINLASKILKQNAISSGTKYLKKYNGYSIRQIKNPDFIRKVFGSAYKIITNNYYTFIGDYVVFANSDNSLINLIDYFETGKSIDLNDNYKDFSNNISSKLNLLVYVKPAEINYRLSEYIDEDVMRQLAMNEDVINSFQGVAMQMSVDKNLFYTNIYIKHGKTFHEENLALWKVKLDAEVAWGPYIVKDYKAKQKSIIVFDKLGKVYYIDSDGKIVWNRKLDAVPMSNIFEVDYYKNRKIQYLFSSGNYIYLIDKKGHDVAGFPKKLHSKATNGIVVFDYLNNKDYRMLVAESDKQIYNYTIKGNEVKGWKLPHMQNIVVEPITRLLANKKDYIIITDIEDNIKIVDRKGRRRIKLKNKVNKAINSDYYVNRTNSKGIIITTNKQGKLVYISASGRLKFTDFGDFSPEHFFLYEDFNGDNSKDFIFIDGTNLTVFDRFKKVLFSYKFSSEINIKPSFFTLGKNQHVLGVVANRESTIYLFDKKGNTIISKGLVGETTFTVGDLKRNNKINLISAAGNMLYNYRLK